MNTDIPAAKSGAVQKGSRKEKFDFLGNDCKDSDQISNLRRQSVQPYPKQKYADGIVGKTTKCTTGT
jgi:hypothetical protein